MTATPANVNDGNLWALLVGIDEYKSPSAHTLRGCVNDAQAMQLFLTNQLHVPEGQIKLLTNADATRANILTAFQQFLIDNPDIPRGSQILFHYSGHGSQMPSRSATEPDALDETIVPHDSRTGDVYDIPDKTLAALLDRLAANKGENITLILDSCHSGSATRMIGDRPIATRRIPADDRLPPGWLDDELRANAHASRALSSGWAVPQTPYVLLAGCRDREESNEYQPAQGVWHGALTFFTLETLKQLPPGSAYADLHERVAAQVNAIYKNQMPQCEGMSKRIIFGGAQVERDPFITVQSVQGSTVTLTAGLVQGLQAGTELAIYGSEVKTRAELPAHSLASVTVTSASATTAQASLLDPPSVPLTPLMRALVTRQVYGGVRQSVALEAAEGQADRDVIARLHQAIAHAAADGGPSPYLEVADDPQALAQLRARAQGGQLSVFGADDTLLVSPVDISTSADGGDAVAQTVRALESIARFRMLQLLSNKDSGSRAMGHIHMRLRRYSTGAQPSDMPVVEKPEGGELVLEFDSEDPQNNRYVVEIVNESPLDVYPHVFYLNPDFAIVRLYPSEGQQEKLNAGSSLYVGLPKSGGTLVDIFLPDDPYWASSRDALKLVATTAPSDLGMLEQKALVVPPPPERRTRAMPSPLEQLLDTVSSGGRTRFLRPSNSAANEDWVTTELSFSIVRRASATPLAAGREQVTLSDGFSLQKPKGFVGQLTISTMQQASRGGTTPRPPLALERAPEVFQPLQRANTRGVGSPALVITLETDDVSLQSVSLQNPLRLLLPEPTDAADLLPIAFDGEDYLLAGYGSNQSKAVDIVNLPRAATPGDTRDLKHAITLFIYKKMGRYTPELGLRYAQLENGKAIYSPVKEAQFKSGDTVALFVHGFTSDTRWMVEWIAPLLRDQVLNYTHLLTFDYESFGTGVAENGAALALALRQQCGFRAEDGISLHVYAHSMGCLVSRCLVELSQGSEFVDRVVLAGPPNHGTALASSSRGLVYVMSGLLDHVSPVPVLGALNWVTKEVYEQSTGWGDIAVDSAVTKQLNALTQPSNVPYLALAGENVRDANLQNRMNRLAQKLLDSTLDTLFGEPNDTVIGVSSMKAVRNGAYPLLTTSILPCDHMSYYWDAQGQAAIKQWVSS